jgi:serine/threonine protein kinase/tetratricopeptide (TPR) repeat protein
VEPQAANTHELPAGDARDGVSSDGRPESIGRFVVTGKLGEGGMGVVYAAYDGELDREVAIKVLRTIGSDSDQARARLIREARAMARLSHPNVITIFDVVAENDRVFIAMELVRGVSLRRWVSVRPRTWRSILESYVDAGRGLAAAHRAGIIHRDFKPDNVLVGEDGRVRVLDFGLARAAGPSQHPPVVPPPVSGDMPVDRITITGAVLGTPAYMAPEQWRGGSVDARTDQFAFCVALWEALFGARPFIGDVPTVLATKVMAGDIGPVREQGDVPTWLIRVLRRGLAPDPADRHPTMDALLEVVARLRRSPMDDSVTPEPETRGRLGPLFARRYELVGGAGGGMVVARDPLSDRTVAIRRIDAGADPLPRDVLVERVRRLAAIRHPNVVAVLDHGATEDGDYLVVERHERAVDPIEFARDQPRPIQLSLLAQLLRAVACLHDRGLVHGHLGPRAIGVVDGHLRIGDLVGCLSDRPRTDVDPAYAAPEMLLGEARSVAADLWSVGMIAHEIVLGRRPHVAATAGAVVDAVLERAPLLAEAQLEPDLAAVLRRLLDPDPRRRFSTAAEALRDLVATTRGALTVETVETRESALRGATLAGRTKELGQLVNALRRSIDGAGELWLVGGESGLGKSRLLDELRSEAVARGAIVVRGQARADGGRPYEVWREVFRMLALGCDDEDEASVLAPQVPDIARLRGRKSRPAPDLDAKSTQQRLARIVASCVGRVDAPLVLLLDDLQWAGSESLDLLQRLTMRLSAMRVLVVGTFRDDEAPQLPSELSAKTIALAPLPPEALRELTAAMTGVHARTLDALVQRETEGNALLFVEVMRFLAEEAGDLHSVGTMVVPEAVSAGGVRRAMRRRLERLSADARPVLEVAAVAGRELDVELLTRVVDRDSLAAALDEGVTAAVLEADGERMRFRHDKLREQLLADLPEARRQSLHGSVAEALCAMPGAQQTHVGAIAHHFHEAGRLPDEARYCGPAGEQALANGAYADAARLLARASALQSHVASERVDRIRWQRKLGEAHYVLGALSPALDGLGGALRELGRPLPTSRIGWGLLLLGQVLVHVVLLVFAGRFVAKQPRRRQELDEAANAAGRIANLSTYSGDVLRVLAMSVLSANLAERAGRPSAYSLAVMGYSASFMGLRGLADRYFARASASAVAQDDPIGLVEATQMECAYRLGLGEFARVRRLLDDGYAAAERADYQLGLALAEGFLGQCDYFLGNFQGMLAHYSRARELITVRSPEHDHSFRCGEAHAYCMLGRFDDAKETLAEATEGTSASYLLGEAFVLTLRAHLAAWQGDGDPRAAANATVAYVETHAIAVPSPCVHVLTGPAEAMIAAARTQPEASVDLRRHVGVLRKWSRKNPVGDAPAWLYKGVLARLQGDHADAVVACEQASISATRLGLRFVQAQAELELGVLRGVDTVPGRGHLERARDLARRCDARWHLERIEALLAESSATGHD